MIFLAVPFFLLELYLSLKVGETIGFIWSVVWIVLTMLMGIKLLKASPFAIMGNLNAVKRGKLSIRNFENASTSYFIGSILLFIPGVLSDLLGVISLGYALYLHFVAKITNEQNNFNSKQGDDNVIDVEIIDEHTDSDRRA